MPCSIEWKKDGVHGVFSGQMYVTEFFQAIMSIISHPNYKKSKYRIYDFSNATTNMDSEELNTLSAMNYHSSMSRLSSHEDKLTAFVSNDEGNKALLSQFISAMQLPSRRQIFSTVEEATDWIQTELERNK